MKGATHCAQRVKQLFRSLRVKLGKVNRPAVGDPIAQLILGVFSRDQPEAKAREAIEHLRSMVVDYNELRVIAPLEMAEHIQQAAGKSAPNPVYPDLRIKCEDLSRALNRIFFQEHTVSLEHLATMPVKDVRAYLDRLDSLEPYTRARVRLLGLQHHAIPLDEAMWALARRERLIDSRAALEEAQHFLERQIAPEDALEFVSLLRKHAWAELATAVRRGEVERIRSVPPDRTSRNMLQLISGDGAKNLDDDLDETEEPSRTTSKKSPLPPGKPAGKDKSARPAAAPGAKSATPGKAALAGGAKPPVPTGKPPTGAKPSAPARPADVPATAKPRRHPEPAAAKRDAKPAEHPRTARPASPKPPRKSSARVKSA